MEKPTKFCNGCKQILSVESFSVRPSTKNGLRSRCKPCENQAAKNYQARNPEKVRESNKRYREENKEKRKVSFTKWRNANKEHRRQYQFQYRATHPVDSIKRLEKKRNWSARNRHKIQNQKNIRRASQIAGGKYLVTKKDLNRIYTSPCFSCGISERITVDHIMPIIRGGRHSIGNLMPLCHKCNSSKGKKTWMEWRMWKIRNQRCSNSSPLGGQGSRNHDADTGADLA